jgi:hypothetical protein
VPSGRPVSLNDLLEEPRQGRSAIAEIAREQLRDENRCVRGSLDDPVIGKLVERSFTPTARHWVRFALAAHGLAIGYPNGLVAGPICSRIDTTIPYPRIAPYLSDLGRQLVAGVRRPER